MPNPLKNLPAKPGRTKPSSQVKKTPKPGNRKFVGPITKSHQERLRGKEPYDYNEGENEVYDLAEQEIRELQRGPKTRKRSMRREQDEYDKEYPGRFGGKPFSGKVDVGQAYYQLRKNLSPENQRLLDILAGRGDDSGNIPF